MIIPLILNVLIIGAKSEWARIYNLNPRGECSPYNVKYLFFFLAPHSMLRLQITYNYGVEIVTELPLDFGNVSSFNWDCGFHVLYSQMPHNSNSVIIVISRVIQVYIEILKCPEGCEYCEGIDAQCIQYLFKFAKFWYTTIESDGWKTDKNVEVQNDTFYTIMLAGGQNNLIANSILERTFKDIPPHFQIYVKFKLWSFSQYDLIYNLTLDDIVYQREQKVYQQIGIQNVEIQQDHSSSDLVFKLQSISTTQHYWALNTFDFYIAKCIMYCEKCFGPTIEECTVCIKGWMYFKGNCLPIPLILVSMIIRMKPKIQNQNQYVPFHISIDEGKNVINDVGLNKVEIYHNFGNIEFTIQANCFQKERIQSWLKSCYQCQTQQQYTQTNDCNKNINFITYHISYSIEVESQIQLLINLQESICQIYQVISAYDKETEILIVKITKSDS